MLLLCFKNLLSSCCGIKSKLKSLLTVSNPSFPITWAMPNFFLFTVLWFSCLSQCWEFALFFVINSVIAYLVSFFVIEICFWSHIQEVWRRWFITNSRGWFWLIKSAHGISLWTVICPSNLKGKITISGGKTCFPSCLRIRQLQAPIAPDAVTTGNRHSLKMAEQRGRRNLGPW